MVAIYNMDRLFPLLLLDPLGEIINKTVKTTIRIPARTKTKTGI